MPKRGIELISFSFWVVLAYSVSFWVILTNSVL